MHKNVALFHVTAPLPQALENRRFAAEAMRCVRRGEVVGMVGADYRYVLWLERGKREIHLSAHSAREKEHDLHSCAKTLFSVYARRGWRISVRSL